QSAIVRHTLGGWEVSSIFSAYSGLPLTITTSGLDPGAQGYNISTSTASGRPSLVGNPAGPENYDFQTGVWLKTAAFAPVCAPATTPAGTACPQAAPGTSGRGVTYGPGFVRIDFSMFKNIKFNERWNLQFRAETFNLLNHTNPNAVSTVQTAATF